MFNRHLILILVALVSSPLFAYISGKVQVKDKIIYCPEKIVCSKPHDITSCSYSAGESQFWNILKANSSNGDSNAEAGEYIFESALSGYHEENRLVSTICRYSNGLNVDGNLISLLANEYSRLEAFRGTKTNWQSANPLMSQGVECKSQNIKLCPMKQFSGFGIIYKKNNENSHLDYWLELRANGMSLSGYETSISSERYYRYTSYNDLTTCWSQKNCKIDLLLKSDSHETLPLGSIIVDMDNKLKINKIAVSSSKGVTISEIKNLNVVDIKRADSYLDNLSVNIENSSTLKGIHPLINNEDVVCRPGGEGKCIIHYYNVKKMCPYSSLCKIDLIYNPRYLHSPVGYFIVNLENNMAIVDVQAARKSVIDVLRTKDNNIKIVSIDLR